MTQKFAMHSVVLGVGFGDTACEYFFQKWVDMGCFAPSISYFKWGYREGLPRSRHPI